MTLSLALTLPPTLTAANLVERVEASEGGSGGQLQRRGEVLEGVLAAHKPALEVQVQPAVHTPRLGIGKEGLGLREVPD